MICPTCKQKITDNHSICPYCGSKIKKSELNQTTKGIKSKIAIEDNSSLVGGTITKDTFIKLEKKHKKKEKTLKDYNSYIDYKEAKEKEAMQSGARLTTKKNIRTNWFEQKRKLSLTNSKEEPTSNQISSYQAEYEENLKRKMSLKKEINKPLITLNKKEHPNQNKGTLFNTLAYIMVFILWLVAVISIVNFTQTDYYFGEDSEEIIKESNSTMDEEMLNYDGVSKSGQTGGTSSEGVTSIVYDNQYLQQFTIEDSEDVSKLIVTDSVKQKTSCPTNIIAIENEIINNYGITAVNLCEMDEDFARELRDVVKYIYENYPNARNYLTNLTLANVDDNTSYMAAFMPVFTFATSNTSTGYPVAIKTQIILNAKYFLNTSKIKNSVNYGANSGYFPANATRSSTVAHEFGHYLSYVALLNYYGTTKLNYVKSSQATVLYAVYNDFNEGTFSYNLVKEAYENYSKDYKGLSFDEFRASISTYAMAKDNNGNYIYDETIAEAFHDVYLNGSEAALASRYIISTLESKL